MSMSMSQLVAHRPDLLAAKRNPQPLEPHIQPRQFHCPVSGCDLEFDSDLALKDHQHSPHARGHCIVSKDPFTCKCSQEFVKLYSLERHIRDFQDSVPAFSCNECNLHKGNDGFKRKDHLVQHLRVFHKYGPEALAVQFPPRKARLYSIAVCHVKGCQHYREPSFTELGHME
ncbi:Uu.00g083040.m01.CDS01 [Anthostomella pinea]|uniref:Uu.00g083040.m01.CDS01 n=1 Tax=Anthostomella pinea TaxID=933095 RepID=A0AAI8VG34_9PEZI|nr:Uu.00g083040.m01.CDS01 [Anthostomella pinea]